MNRFVSLMYVIRLFMWLVLDIMSGKFRCCCLMVFVSLFLCMVWAGQSKMKCCIVSDADMSFCLSWQAWQAAVAVFFILCRYWLRGKCPLHICKIVLE